MQEIYPENYTSERESMGKRKRDSTIGCFLQIYHILRFLIWLSPQVSGNTSQFKHTNILQKREILAAELKKSSHQQYGWILQAFSLSIITHSYDFHGFFSITYNAENLGRIEVACEFLEKHLGTSIGCIPMGHSMHAKQ